ncbi:MAG TPA: hypothetical protein VF932_19140 [Anaerolineae bacterium]
MKRVFILSCHPLFSKGVETLLRQQQGFDIVGRESDLEKAIIRLKELRPDVVILDMGVPGGDYGPIRSRILDDNQGVKIVGLNLENNTFSIYHEEQRILHQVQDLMQAIENGQENLEPSAHAKSELASTGTGLDRKEEAQGP